MDAFEAVVIVINDGVGSGWYIVPPVAVNGQGGDDRRVLVAQLTTTVTSAVSSPQVFPDGDQVSDFVLTYIHPHSCVHCSHH